jgi:phytoene dehydrogenase-like protein
MPSSEAIVIGAGINGLAAALTLATAGRSVTVVEAADDVGGAAVTVEFAPGFRAPHVAHLLNQIDPRLDDALRGETLVPLGSVALARDGNHLSLDGAFGASLSGDMAAGEAQRWAALRSTLLRHSGVLAGFRTELPPRLGAGASRGDYLTLGKLGFSIRRLGRDDMREFLRLILINVADVLEEELTDDRLRGLVAFDATLGSHTGPRSPNSLMNLWYRLSGQVNGERGALAVPKGGIGSIAQRLASCVRAAGGEIRLSSRVARIEVENDRAVGVTLESGERLAAPVVVSATAPQTTLLNLLGARHLDTDTVRRVQAIRARGNAAKLHLALDRLPVFRGLDPAKAGARLVIAPSIDHVERAFNPAKYGQASPEPVMEITIPSVHDASLAPPGKHVLSAIVQYAPYRLAGGWDKSRAAFVNTCMETLEAYAPGIGKLTTAFELLTPADIETRYGMPGGQWHHAELAVEQLFMLRPAPGLARYATPVEGVWLASAGTHPGGGVSGTPGVNAAEAVIRDGGRR